MRRSRGEASHDECSDHAMKTDRAPRCPCEALDTHTHVVPREFPAYLGSRKGVAWPSMVPAAQQCHRHLMISGQIYRTISQQCWDPSDRIQDMDRSGIGQQVLSPMPELLSYWLATEDAAALTLFLNETVAEMVRSSPHRFVGLAAVPLQDIDAAIAGIEHAVRDLGLVGVEIGSNVNGVSIGDARFLPFFEVVESLDAVVFVHALRPSGMDRLVGPPLLEQVLAFPGEIGLAAASLLTGGMLGQLPHLRIAFSHGGGSLPALLTRLQHAWESMPAIHETMTMSPREAAQTIFYDDLVYDGRAIETLVRLYGKTQVMIGSDYPFAIMDREPATRVDALDLSEETKDLLRYRNAERWLYGGSEHVLPANDAM